MTNYSRSSSFYSNSYDNYIDRTQNSTIGKMQQQYWVTKHAVLQKLGKKEDEFIVASDAELDAKLELFHAIAETSQTLQKVIELYQDKLLALSQEENCLGRFLKEQGKLDKTRAGKMMGAAGKSLSYTAQQRLSLRVPLVRLHQEVETFRSRAISDTLVTVTQMEGRRSEYRGALHWMKDVSQELDPDTFKQLEKFRKVQTQVRRTKAKFDKLKIDCLQKIDLLAASRCNMFSHALATYQNTLLTFWKKTSRTMSAVAESFKGYQHYEFSMLKELTEPSRKLAEETSNSLNEANGDDDLDKDRLIFFEEYHDDETEEKNKKDTLKEEEEKALKNSSSVTKELSDALLDLSFDESAEKEVSVDESDINKNTEIKGIIDLLTDETKENDEEKDDLTLLNEILSIPNDNVMNADGNWSTAADQANQNTEFSPDWQAAFGPISNEVDKTMKDFLPSQLLESTLCSSVNQNLQACAAPIAPVLSANNPPASSSTTVSKVKRKAPQTNSSNQNKTKDKSEWFNLFADLDPLSNPDAVGKAADDGTEDDRNC